jgi:hypothetical protein
MAPDVTPAVPDVTPAALDATPAAPDATLAALDATPAAPDASSAARAGSLAALACLPQEMDGLSLACPDASFQAQGASSREFPVELSPVSPGV